MQNKEPQYVYRIVNTKTGLFSTGGMKPNFTKHGKTWTKLQYVRAHISELVGRDPADIYNDCVIVEAEITETLKPIESANSWLIKKTDEAIAYQEKRVKDADTTTWWGRNGVETLKEYKERRREMR